MLLLLCVAVSGLGVLFAGAAGMYNVSSYDGWITNQYYHIAEAIANQVMAGYGADISDVPQWLLEQSGYAYASEKNVNSWFDLQSNEWYYMIKDSRGNVVVGSQSNNVANPVVYAFENRSTTYLEIIGREAQEVPTTVDATEVVGAPSSTAPTIASESYAYTETYWDPNTGEAVYVISKPVEGHHVTVGISRNYLGYTNYSGLPQAFWEILFCARMTLIAMIVVSFSLFAAAFVFLMIIAGKDPKTGEANPKALNKLPLDLYLAAGIIGTALGAMAIYELMDLVLYENMRFNVPVILLICGCSVAVATLDLGFFTALAAQFKVPEYYWLTNSICVRVLKLVWKYARKVLAYVGKGFRRIAKYIREVFGMLPVIWEWIAVGAAMGIVLLLICAGSTAHWYTIFPMLLWCLMFAAIVIYCGWCYGNIRKGTQRMNEGNLNEKIDTKWMEGSFKRIAEDLNQLADVVQQAAEKQLKSERMKTELITNVSHDIKTPLTSVINYVDLLQQPHTEEEGSQYLEVLSRQSVRLKKLVEDLMDMSKASSGNMAVHIEEVDAVETVNQALGEFADKLEAARLTPVFHTPDLQLHMKADGKLTWRVLSNLLSNVVKYALPGTRVYIDLLRLDKSVVLSVKNISREELNISAEELTERFVRGDASRKTEGSGLGLNIAQSLMQLQGGNLELTVDGDLFKVTLTFPTE